MHSFTNPYTPGAGFMPAYLAGRDALQTEAERMLKSIQMRYPQRSVVYYGLRGVGKTVLLNSIENMADELGILYSHIEAGDDKFISRLSATMSKLLRGISAKKNAEELVQKGLSLLRSFRIAYKIEDGTVELGMDNDASFSSGVLSEDLSELFITLGKAAVKSEDTICLFIDEMQSLEKSEIASVVSALHRCNQLRLPVMMFCAGLPKIVQAVGDACSYAERLFVFHHIDALSAEEVAAAIREPALDLDVQYEDAAISYISEVTGGYPFFIQEYCNTIWGHKDDSDLITKDTVVACEPAFIKALDEGFFSVRYARCTPREKDFIAAMVKCKHLPCSISNVAKFMGKNVSSISPVRGQLISKGMIYATGHAEIDFTVPKFDEFVRRVNPTLDVHA